MFQLGKADPSTCELYAALTLNRSYFSKVFEKNEEVCFNFEEPSDEGHSVQYRQFYTNSVASASNMPAKPLTCGVNGVDTMKIVARGVSAHTPNGTICQLCPLSLRRFSGPFHHV